ncbi:MAG: hypothetical protein EOP85_08945 [Verrucomicrobiaceae bacterium]|nr:MAG: hypothetical protein EOP85_08945 [Verrucomicrobiaceae bacterium]
MKPFPNKRVVWLIIPLVPVVLMTAVLWYAGRPDAEAIARRGAEPPPEKKFSLVDPGSWSVTADWLGDGMDALMTWEYNPWREQWKRDRWFGKRIEKLQNSNNPEDKAELERLRKMGQEWYERILARYPELAMKPVTPVAPGENGYLQWQKLMESVLSSKGHLFQSPIPQDLVDHIRKGNDPDMAALKSWLEANRARIEEIRAIGLLPAQAAEGTFEEVQRLGSNTWVRHASDALMLDARAAMADGDTARALESIRAMTGLADHLSDNGSPTLIGTMLAYNIRGRAERYVLESLLSSASPGSIDTAAWQAALNPTLRAPSEMADTIRGEWNIGMPASLLAVLSDSADPGTPRDADYLAELYTRHTAALIKQAEGVSLKEYAASPQVVTSVDQLSRRSRELQLVNQWDPRSVFVRGQEQTGLTQAAFAIMNGQPVPVDPVYGLPYKWDPVKRELALPDIPDKRNYKTRPVTVPRM